MPVYVYKNLTTGATFEVEQRITESALAADPVTGDPVKRLIQPVGIAFKGSGFYVNDSRGKKGTTAIAKSDAAKPGAGNVDGGRGEGGKSDGGASDGGTAAPTAPAAVKPAAAASAAD